MAGWRNRFQGILPRYGYRYLHPPNYGNRFLSGMPRAGWRNVSIRKDVLDRAQRHIDAGLTLARHPAEFAAAQLDDMVYELRRGSSFALLYELEAWQLADGAGMADWKRRRAERKDRAPTGLLSRRRGPVGVLALPNKVVAAIEGLAAHLPFQEVAIVVETVLMNRLVKLDQLERQLNGTAS